MRKVPKSFPESSEIFTDLFFYGLLRQRTRYRNNAVQNERNTVNDNNEKRTEALVYTIEETAAALKCCTKSVRRLIKRGFFSPCKALRKIIIPRTQIDDFLKRTCGIPTAKF